MFETNPEVVLQPQILNKQRIGEQIEEWVSTGEYSYLEAATRWLDENNFPESHFGKYIPDIIVEKIKQEAIDNRSLRPSFAEQNESVSLDFMWHVD